jgi:hypothetical protein
MKQVEERLSKEDLAIAAIQMINLVKGLIAF